MLESKEKGWISTIFSNNLTFFLLTLTSFKKKFSWFQRFCLFCNYFYQTLPCLILTIELLFDSFWNA